MNHDPRPISGPEAAQPHHPSPPPSGQGARRGWWIHLGVFVIVNTLWLAAWAAGGSTQEWRGPSAGWALGLALHGLAVFMRPPARPHNGLDSGRPL